MVLVDQESSLSDQFIAFRRRRKDEVFHTCVDVHSLLWIGERHHQPLWTTFRKLSISYPTVQKVTLLAMPVKVMNDILRHEGLVPSTLVLGEFPQLRVHGPVNPARPEVLYEVSRSYQITQGMLKKDTHYCIKSLNTAIRWEHEFNHLLCAETQHCSNCRVLKRFFC